MKVCICCKSEKPISDFYAHPMMGDGHLGKCKSCCKRQANERRLALLGSQEWVRSERERCRIKGERYRKAGLSRQSSNAVKQRWADKNKHKIKAERVALRTHRTPPMVCEHCKKPSKIMHRHHADYTKPKDIVWLCPPCHGIEHRKDK